MIIHLLVALLSGAMMPLAFAPFSFWPIAILAPAILFFQMQFITRAVNSFWVGYCFGLGYFGFGVNWVYQSLHEYGQASPFVAGSLTVFLIAYLSLFVGFATLLLQKLKVAWGFSRALFSMPLLWFSLEWLKGWLFTGFPWLSLGYAHIHSPLAGFAPVTGVYGLGALSVLISVLLVIWKNEKRWYSPVILVILGASGYLLQLQEWTQRSGRSIDVVMIQGNISQEMKWQYDERAKIIGIYQDQTGPYWGSDLIIWPEAAIPGRSEDLQTEVLKPLAETALSHGSHLLTGIVVSDWMQRIYFNSMLMLGAGQGVYHKRHLVPFGEYFPLRGLLDFMRGYINIPMSDMSAGPNQQALLQVNDVPLGVSICFEDVFSRDINRDLPEAQILVNTSNDAWFGDSSAPHQHLQIARMRALETGRPMARSTNTGRSAFIDHRGRIISFTEMFTGQSLQATMQGRSGKTPFVAISGFQPWFAGLILGVLLSLIWKSSRTA